MHEILAVKQQTIYKLIEAEFLVLKVLQVIPNSLIIYSLQNRNKLEIKF
jgi:hypothetical protein